MKKDEIIWQNEVFEMARDAGSIDSEIVIFTVYNAFVAKEREACAKVCEGLNLYGGSESRQLQRATLKDCAYAIRARGETTLRGEA